MDEERKKSTTEETILDEINRSLANQVREEIGETDLEESEQEAESEIEFSKKRPLWIKIIVSLFLFLLVAGVAGGIYLNYVLDQATIEKQEDILIQEETFEKDDNISDLKEVHPDEISWDNLNELSRKEADVTNILLAGEEAIKDGGRGRTDCIMIATINKKEKALKLTSLMRDLYVQVPGYQDNKLNAAYNIGGMPLLVDTIKQNLNLEVDGYVLVDFDKFEKVIDRLGGVEITLTDWEASYLNRTNYISNPAYRNVKSGKQVLNGNQALGYSRIRYVKTADNLRDDFGRNARQRAILMAIFNKYKSKSAVDLITMLPDILSLVTTDLDKNDMIGYIATILTLGANELETFRIPVEGAYEEAKVREMAVLLPTNWSKNIDALHKFIFGDETLSSEVPIVNNLEEN